MSSSHRFVSFACALIALSLVGCERRLPTSSEVALRHEAASAARVIAGDAAVEAQHLVGEVAGAAYVIDVPAEWNGGLVLYAHGYTLPQLPVVIPSGQDGYDGIRERLLARGFAVAVTSFSENGYAEAEGARQVRQLGGVFADRVATPSRVFLLGQSLGGLIALELAESFPGRYAGALVVSGVLGGTRREIDYIGDVRALFDVYAPGVLGGTVTDVPDGPYPQNAVVQALQAHPERIGLMACTFRDPAFRLAGRDGNELFFSIVRVLGFQWLAAEDLIDRTHQHQLYDNTGVAYVGCAPSSVLGQANAAVTRYASTPDARNYMAHHYEPTGALQIPLLALHATDDPVVPAGHEAVYHDKAAAAGSLGFLAQCIPNRYGHTEAFHPDEVVAAFDALVEWVNTGQKPSCPVPSVP